MSEIIAVVMYVAGLVTGLIVVYWSYKIGFKASIEARLLDEEASDDRRLFKDKTAEPAEFQLLKDNNRKEEDDDVY